MVSNVDAKAHSDPEAIRDTLARQVSSCFDMPANPAESLKNVACLPWLFPQENHHLHDFCI